MTVFVIDIDTTIANNEHRHELLQRQCKICLNPVIGKHRASCGNCGSSETYTPQSGWDAFVSPEAMAKDLPIKEAQRVINEFRKIGIEHHYLTGRNERSREVTLQWLIDHYGFNAGVNKLIMRSKHLDGISASDYKEMEFLKLKSLYPDNTRFVFAEDDEYVFSMYSKYGIVLRCPEAWSVIFPSGKNRVLEPAWNV